MHDAWNKIDSAFELDEREVMKMGKKKLGMMILALLASAYGNNGQPNAPNGESEDFSSGESEDGVASKSISYEKLYQTSVFLGGSITEGLSYHDVLDEENVLAGVGKTAEFALKEDVDRLVSRMPEHIYIQQGSDDILWPKQSAE